MGLSALSANSVVFIFGCCIVFGIKAIRKKKPQGRYYFDYTLLKLPILGVLLRKIAVAIYPYLEP